MVEVSERKQKRNHQRIRNTKYHLKWLTDSWIAEKSLRSHQWEKITVIMYKMCWKPLRVAVEPSWPLRGVRGCQRMLEDWNDWTKIDINIRNISFKRSLQIFGRSLSKCHPHLSSAYKRHVHTLHRHGRMLYENGRPCSGRRIVGQGDQKFKNHWVHKGHTWEAISVENSIWWIVLSSVQPMFIQQTARTLHAANHHQNSASNMWCFLKVRWV